MLERFQQVGLEPRFGVWWQALWSEFSEPGVVVGPRGTVGRRVYSLQDVAFCNLGGAEEVIDVEGVYLFARDASFVNFFLWAGKASWAMLILFPFFAWLLRVSAR